MQHRPARFQAAKTLGDSTMSSRFLTSPRLPFPSHVMLVQSLDRIMKEGMLRHVCARVAISKVTYT